MTTVRDIVAAMEEYAPLHYAVRDDNCGLLVGRESAETGAVLVALDVTSRVIGEAQALGARLIVSHHPVFFQIGSVTDRSCQGSIILQLAEAGIAACCMHTNLDAAERGVNDTLMRALGLPEPYTPYAILAQGRQGRDIGQGLWSELPEAMDPAAFALQVKQALGCSVLRYTGSGAVRRVGVCSGGGGSVFGQAVTAGCDTFVTGDCKHSLFLEAEEMGVNLIDAGHFRTEDVICEPVAEYLRERFPQVSVHRSEACVEPFRCL